MGQSERNPRIVEEFLRRRKRQVIVIIPAVLAVASLVAADQSLALFGMPRSVMIGLALALIVGCVGFSFTNWRCPSCQRYLGKALNPKFCVQCGVPLQ